MAASREREAYGLLLVPILLAVYLISFNARFRADDEHILAARAQSLALRGQLEAPQVYGNDRVRQQAAWGESANQVEPALSWLGSGLYRVGVSMGWGGRQAQFTLNIYATAFAAALVYLTVATLGYAGPTAFIAGLAFGLASPAFPYALTFYRDPLAMAFVALALWGVALTIRGHPRKVKVGVGLLVVGLAGGILSKNSSLALFPALLLALAAGGWKGERPASKNLWVALGAIAAAGAAAVMLLEHQGPLARFSVPYYTFLAEHFLNAPKGPALAAVVGAWLSPAKSMLLFVPPLLLLLWMGWIRRIPITFIAIALGFTVFLSAAQGLFYGRAWGSGFGWGLRFLLPALPGLLVLTAPAIDCARQSARGRRLLGLLVGVGVLFQVAAAWVPWRHAFQAWGRAGLDPYAAGAAWMPGLLQIPRQLGYLIRPALWDVAWLRLLQFGRYRALVLPILALLVLSAALLVLRSLYRDARAATASVRPALALAGISLLMPLVPTLALLQSDPALVDHRRNFRDAVRWLEPRLQERDAVIVDSYATPLWTLLTNRWTSPHAWHSLPYEIPGTSGTSGDPHPATVKLFERELLDGARIWYLTTPEAPDFGLRRELDWLDRHRRLESAVFFPGDVPLYVYVYR